MGHDIFSPLVGRDGAKAVLRNALRNGDVHVCLVGAPASGKSIAMTCIDEAMGPDARMIDASGVTASKLRDIIAENYEVLLLDEIDDMDSEAAEALSMPMEHGRVTKATSRSEYDVEIDTQFISSANDKHALPTHIQSRFRYVEFPEYTEEQFVEVCSRVLVDSVDWVTSEKVARKVAKTILDETGTKDCREVIDIAQLAGDSDRVIEIAQSMKDPDADVESDPLLPHEIQFRDMSDRDLDRIIKTMMNIERRSVSV